MGRCGFGAALYLQDSVEDESPGRRAGWPGLARSLAAPRIPAIRSAALVRSGVLAGWQLVGQDIREPALQGCRLGIMDVFWSSDQVLDAESYED